MNLCGEAGPAARIKEHADSNVGVSMTMVDMAKNEL